MRFSTLGHGSQHNEHHTAGQASGKPRASNSLTQQAGRILRKTAEHYEIPLKPGSHHGLARVMA
ncbi:hypothetical protein [Rhodoferax sp.]|uniref:hypothetical protein n=1 Tax=Rhodoferax sp. TaxID=50421 RepID=UPI00374D0532